MKLKELNEEMEQLEFSKSMQRYEVEYIAKHLSYDIRECAIEKVAYAINVLKASPGYDLLSDDDFKDIFEKERTERISEIYYKRLFMHEVAYRNNDSDDLTQLNIFLQRTETMLQKIKRN